MEINIYPKILDSTLKTRYQNTIQFKKSIEDNKIDTVLHLACISNDPTYELNPELSKKINYDCFEDLVKISKEQKVEKFIYASTCSVYGISSSSMLQKALKTYYRL